MDKSIFSKGFTMEFLCPVCKTSGNISNKNLEHPVTKTTCQQCAAILLINPENGNVDAHTAPIKDTQSLKGSRKQPAESLSPTLSMRPMAEDSRDWPAIIVFVIVLAILISTGILLGLNVAIS
jgi:hypothetical protein